MTWLRVGPQTPEPLHNHGLSAHLLPTKIQAQCRLASNLLRFFLPRTPNPRRLPISNPKLGGAARQTRRRKDGEGRRWQRADLGDGGGSGAEPAGGAVAVQADPAGAELAGAAARVRGADGEEGGVPRHLPLRRRGEVAPQHQGPTRRRAPHTRPPQPRPPPVERNEESRESLFPIPMGIASLSFLFIVPIVKFCCSPCR